MAASGGLFLEIWEMISDQVSNNRREDMARKLIAIFTEHGMERDDFLEIKGEDDHLDAAIDSFYSSDKSGYDYDYDEDAVYDDE